jgi:hypothetical protein
MSKKFLFVDAQGFQTEADSYETSDFTAVGGAGNENAPVLLDGSGLLASSMINEGAIDHGNLAGLADDDHVQYLLIDGTRAMTGNLQLGSNEAISSAVPSTANSLVNKAYADSLRTENGMKGNVAVATTANITLSGLQTIDGYLTVAGDRVLVKNQTAATENGIYEAASGAWTRSEDMDNSPTAEIVNGVLVPRVQNSSSGQDSQSFYISSVGTGTDGVHTIGVDDIDFDIYTTSTQLSAGSGIDIAANVINIDLAVTDPGLYFDGSDDLGIDWSSAFNDARAIKASDLSSNANGLGASIIGIEDAGGFTLQTDVEGSLQELYGLIAANGVEYTVATGGVTKGDLVYVSANDEASPYSTITTGNRGIGLALETKNAAEIVKVLANDTVLSGVLSGATAGDIYYWNGTSLTTTIPSGAGQYVWAAGIAKNATDLHVEVQFVKKNA